MTMFNVQMASGSTLQIEGADAYQQEGPMTTFFQAGTSRLTIDSWSVRLASYRTTEITAINRVDRVVEVAAA